MITSDTLILKLKLQSKLLAKSLNLPEKFGNDLLATAIYQHFDFNELCESASEYQKLKYLFICEIEDKKFIEDLHIEIEKMALRLEEMVIINITRIQLISLLYELFKLDYESKYMIEAKEIDLRWQPYFQTLTDNKSVLFSDIQVNSVPFRLIATKFNLNEISVQTFIEQIKSEVKKSEHNAYEDLESHVNWFSRAVALLTKPMSKSSYEIPELFKRDEVRFSSFCHQIRNNLLSHKDACILPINFTNGYCFFWFRSYSEIDFLENSL